MRLSISNVALLVLGFQSTVFGRAVPEALSHAGNSALLGDSHPPRHLTPRVIDPVPVHIGDPVEVDPVTGRPRTPVDPNPAPTDPETQPVHIGEGGSGEGGNINRVLDYDTYRTKGQAVNTELHGSITNSEADVTRRPRGQATDLNVGKYADINDGYSLPINRDRTPMPDLQAAYNYIPESGLTQFTNWDKYEIRSNVNGDIARLPVNDGAYDRRSGTILAMINFQERDTWPRGDPHRLPWSELTWQTWSKAAGPQRGFPNSDIGNLQYVLRQNVQNKGTMSVVEQAHSKNGIPNDQMGEFEEDPTNVEKSNAFYALLGTDNIKGVAFMLKDHHNEAGNKVIKKIVTFPKGSPNSGNKLSILIVLGTN